MSEYWVVNNNNTKTNCLSMRECYDNWEMDKLRIIRIGAIVNDIIEEWTVSDFRLVGGTSYCWTVSVPDFRKGKDVSPGPIRFTQEQFRDYCYHHKQDQEQDHQEVIMKIFKSLNLEKQTDLVRSLMQEIGMTFYESFEEEAEELKTRGLLELRNKANLKSKPTSLLYLREILTRLWYFLFSCNRIQTRNGSLLCFFYDVADRAKIKKYIDAKYGHGGEDISKKSIRSLQEMICNTDKFFISHIDQDCYEQSIMVSSIMFMSSAELTDKLSSMGIIPYEFKSEYLEDEWAIQRVMYIDKQIKDESYENFKQNWAWLRENKIDICSSEKGNTINLDDYYLYGDTAPSKLFVRTQTSCTAVCVMRKLTDYMSLDHSDFIVNMKNRM